jgi:hypothetical protein
VVQRELTVMGFPIFITRVSVGKGPGVVMLSMESPGGQVRNGEVDHVEAMRVVMSTSTFHEVAELFARTAREIQAQEQEHQNGGKSDTPLPFTVPRSSRH